MAGLLSIELDAAVALVTLCRPEKRNALSIDLRLELADAFARLGEGEDVRCAVLTGAGSAFCSGITQRSSAATAPTASASWRAASPRSTR